MRSLSSRKALLGAALVVGSTLFVLAGRGGDATGDADTPPPPPAEDDLTEPITDEPFWPEPGDETGPIYPFAPPPSDPASDVPIEALTAEEQAYALAGTDTTGWDAVHAGFAAASIEAGVRAEAEAAANAQGLDGLGDVGVLP
jgi:hypothetical protein